MIRGHITFRRHLSTSENSLAYAICKIENEENGEIIQVKGFQLL